MRKFPRLRLCCHGCQGRRYQTFEPRTRATSSSAFLPHPTYVSCKRTGGHTTASADVVSTYLRKAQLRPAVEEGRYHARKLPDAQIANVPLHEAIIAVQPVES